MSDFATDFPAVDDRVIRADGEALYQLSASAISKLLICPEQFRLSYMLGIWPKASAATVLGNAYHHARRVNYEQKIFSGVDLPDISEAYRQGWEDAVSRDEIAWRDKDSQEMYGLGLAMARQYHAKVSPRIQPVATEERFEFYVPGVPVPVVGYIDVRDETTMYDTKTANQGAKQPQPGWRPQAFIYCAARPGYDFEWHVHSKSGKTLIWTPQAKGAQALSFVNTSARRHAAEMMARHAWRLLIHYTQSYGLSEPWPGNGLVNGFACKNCSYKNRCAYWV